MTFEQEIESAIIGAGLSYEQVGPCDCLVVHNEEGAVWGVADDWASVDCSRDEVLATIRGWREGE